MTDIVLQLEIGECNGTMQIVVTNERGTVKVNPVLTEGVTTVKFDTEIPDKVYIQLSGKDNRRDTIIDPQSQKVIKDKYIKVIELKVDGKPLPQSKVQQMFNLETDKHGTINSSYWGFNGKVVMDFPYSDSLEYHLQNL
jgi:hypothetical protein